MKVSKIYGLTKAEKAERYRNEPPCYRSHTIKGKDYLGRDVVLSRGRTAAKKRLRLGSRRTH